MSLDLKLSDSVCINKKYYVLFARELRIRDVKIDVYGRPVTANAKLQVGFSVEMLAVRS